MSYRQTMAIYKSGKTKVTSSIKTYKLQTDVGYTNYKNG